MKETIVKALAAIICVAIFCSMLTSAIGNYTDAMKSIAGFGGSDSGYAGSISDGSIDDQAYPDSEMPVDGTVDNSAAGDSADSATDSEISDIVGAGETTTEAGSADPSSYSKEQAVRYYTESMKKSYSSSKVTIKKTDSIDINVISITPGGNIATKVANKIIEAYATTTEGTKSFAKGVATDESKETAEAFSVPVALDPRGAKTATVTKKGNDYEINILVVPEAATLKNFPVYNKQCSFPLDLASVDLFGINVTSADFSYTGTKLKAVVGADGYVKYAEVYMPLAGGGGGNLIGIDGSAEVSGSMTKTMTFTY